MPDAKTLWECSHCDCVWLLEDFAPFDREMNYCSQCGRYIEAIVVGYYDYEAGKDVERTITRKEWEARGK